MIPFDQMWFLEPTNYHVQLAVLQLPLHIIPFDQSLPHFHVYSIQLAVVHLASHIIPFDQRLSFPCLSMRSVTVPYPHPSSRFLSCDSTSSRHDPFRSAGSTPSTHYPIRSDTVPLHPRTIPFGQLRGRLAFNPIPLLLSFLKNTIPIPILLIILLTVIS